MVTALTPAGMVKLSRAPLLENVHDTTGEPLHDGAAPAGGEIAPTRAHYAGDHRPSAEQTAGPLHTRPIHDVMPPSSPPRTRRPVPGAVGRSTAPLFASTRLCRLTDCPSPALSRSAHEPCGRQISTTTRVGVNPDFNGVAGVTRCSPSAKTALGRRSGSCSTGARRATDSEIRYPGGPHPVGAKLRLSLSACTERSPDTKYLRSARNHRHLTRRLTSSRWSSRSSRIRSRTPPAACGCRSCNRTARRAVRPGRSAGCRRAPLPARRHPAKPHPSPG